MTSLIHDARVLDRDDPVHLRTRGGDIIEVARLLSRDPSARRIDARGRLMTTPFVEQHPVAEG